MLKTTQHFLRDESGLESVEFAAITALIVGVIVIALIGLGEVLRGRYAETEDTVNP